MPFEDIILLPSAQVLILTLVKLLFVIGAILYLIFGFIVVRQIQLMRSTVITPFSGVIQLLGIVHLLFAFLVLALFIVSL